MAVTSLDLAGGQVRSELERWAPGEVVEFNDEFRRALERAGDSFDLGEVAAVVARWRRVAALRSMPLSDGEQRLVAAAQAGDERGLYEQLSDGSFRLQR